jgi:nitric oxide reductase NorE protein
MTTRPAAFSPPAGGPARQAPALPGDVALWVFVLGDMVIFGVYFIIFMVYRGHEQASFLASQRHLSLASGAVNTLLLLASSRFVALAVAAARAGKDRRARRLIHWGALCGCGFLLVKAHEWDALVSTGLTVTHGNFFMFYYAFTGVHLVHVLVGLIVLGVMRAELRRPGGRPGPAPRVRLIEAGALYWHMVDLLWIILFALLYLMR